MKRLLIIIISLVAFAGLVNAERFNFSDVVFEKCVDGKSIVATICDQPAFWGKGITVKLAGITGPEITSYDERERIKAIKARDALYYLCTSSKNPGQPYIYLGNCERNPEKFGIIADVYVDTYDGLINVADAMVELGLAEPQ